jgi:hypothetical protein
MNRTTGWKPIPQREVEAPVTQRKNLDRVNASLDRGLAYLASQQRRDGSWSSNNACNALSLLAFMGRGHVPGRGKYAELLERGKRFLLGTEHAEIPGYFSLGTMYEHGLVTLCLAEMYGMDPDPELEAKLRRAVKLIEATQSPRGGWRYNPAPDNQDLSVTVIQIVALRAANNAEIPVDPNVIQRAIQYVKLCAVPTGGFGYEGRNGMTPQTTAAGILSLQLLGLQDDPQVQKSVQYLQQFLRSDTREQWENSGLGYFYYFHYYAIQAHYQHGGKPWSEWHPRVREMFLERQNRDGSWDIPGGTSEAASVDANRIYSTAMACLVLDIDLHFLPAYQR